MECQLKDFYNSTLRQKLFEELGLKNINQVPKVAKVVVNSGVKGVTSDSKLLAYVVDGLTQITGQQAVKTVAKKSIAGFKLREGQAIGSMVTLRGNRMFSFLEKLIRVVVPSIRDFRGLKAKFDESGNYNLGLRDWMIFPEVDYDRFPNSKGLNITIQIQGGDSIKSLALLKGLGMPFADK